MGMDQYLLIPFLGGWTSIYQLFWCSPGVQGFDTLPYIYIGSPCLLIHPPFLCQMIPQVAMSRFSPYRPRLGLPVSPLCDRTDFRLGKSQASRSHRPKMGTKNGDQKWGPPMTGNGTHTTYRNGDLLLFYPNLLFYNVLYHLLVIREMASCCLIPWNLQCSIVTNGWPTVATN